jgi:Bacterial HORMA domain family 1
MSTYSYTESTTFTITHARHMAAKVATDLKRMQRFYGFPSDENIADFEAEVTELLRTGCLSEITYGFRRNENWIEPTLRYTARDLAGAAANDDDPGRIRAGANIEGASFYSYLLFSSAWDMLSESEQNEIRSRIPVKRGYAPALGIDGYLSSDLTYSSGGRCLNRSCVRSYS